MSGYEAGPDPVTFDCEQSVRRLWDYLDNALDTAEMAAVDAHLAECDRCPPHFAFERRFLAVVRAARADVVPVKDGDANALRARVVQRLLNAGELSTGKRAE